MTHLLLVVVQVCFATLPLAGKKALAGIPANAIVLTRIAGGALVFLVLARSRGGPHPARRDLGRIALLAVLGVVLNQLLFVNGLERSTAVNASVLGTTIPVFTAGLAILAGQERFARARVLGILVALAGTLVLVKVDRFSLSDETAVGNLMILGNALSYATFLVLVRDLAARVAPLPLVAALFGAALPFAAVPGVPASIELAPHLTWANAGWLAFLVAVPTVTAYALNQIALARADASLVAVYIYLQPLLATLGAVLLLGERPGARVAVAAVLVAAGVALGARGRVPSPT